MDILRSAQTAAGKTVSQSGRVARSAMEWLGSEFSGGASFSDQAQGWQLFLSEYAKALYEGGINDYASRITRSCARDSIYQCEATGFLNLGLGGLNAANPLFYIKQAYMTCITMYVKEGLITDHDAIRYRNAVEVVFAAADLAQVLNLAKGLAANAGKLDAVRITNSGGLDGRFAPVKELNRLLQEALQTAVENVGGEVAEKK